MRWCLRAPGSKPGEPSEKLRPKSRALVRGSARVGRSAHPREPRGSTRVALGERHRGVGLLAKLYSGYPRSGAANKSAARAGQPFDAPRGQPATTYHLPRRILIAASFSTVGCLVLRFPFGFASPLFCSSRVQIYAFLYRHCNCLAQDGFFLLHYLRVMCLRWYLE